MSKIEIKPQDHPDFVGGWVWTSLEARWIEERIAEAILAEREARDKDTRDAERYRHMRNNAQFQSRNGPGLYWYLPRFSDGNVRDEAQQLDAAIDAAIRARGRV